MARRGRFARQTGGSDLSSLIYSIMQQQYSRTTSALIAAYRDQTDYRGNGIPTADEVIAYLVGQGICPPLAGAMTAGRKTG